MNRWRLKRSDVLMQADQPAGGSTRGDVYLLGAGFSRAVSGHMPLLRDLAGLVLKRYPNHNYVTPDVELLMTGDFAHALSYLEHSKPWLSEAQSALLTHETIRALWQQAGQLLQRARRVVCMGYSLPPSDIIMHHFLRTTLSRGVPVEVVDESAAVVSNYRSALAHVLAKVSGAFAGDRAIRRFVESLAT